MCANFPCIFELLSHTYFHLSLFFHSHILINAYAMFQTTYYDLHYFKVMVNSPY